MRLRRFSVSPASLVALTVLVGLACSKDQDSSTSSDNALDASCSYLVDLSGASSLGQPNSAWSALADSWGGGPSVNAPARDATSPAQKVLHLTLHNGNALVQVGLGQSPDLPAGTYAVRAEVKVSNVAPENLDDRRDNDNQWVELGAKAGPFAAATNDLNNGALFTTEVKTNFGAYADFKEVTLPQLVNLVPTSSVAVAFKLGDAASDGRDITVDVRNVRLRCESGECKNSCGGTRPPIGGGTGDVSPNFKGVFTQHDNAARTGANVAETNLTPQRVQSGGMHMVAGDAKVDGKVYAQPLYARLVDLPGRGKTDVVYVATMSNRVYMLEAGGLGEITSTALPNAPAVECRNVPDSCCTADNLRCDDHAPIGILSTPVIDPDTWRLYLVAKTPAGLQLHVLDARTLQPVAGFAPITIDGAHVTYGDVAHPANSRFGPGDDGTTTHFDANIQVNRPGLLLTKVGGRSFVHVASGVLGDGQSNDHRYHGWVITYDVTARNETPVATFNATPGMLGDGDDYDGRGGSVWQSGGGLVADATGNVYAMTGNGMLARNTGAPIYGAGRRNSYAQALLKLAMRPGAAQVQPQLLDSFTPANVDELNRVDADFGSFPPTLIDMGTAGRFVLGGGKEGKLYVLDANNFANRHAGDELWVDPAGLDDYRHHIHSSPAVWTRDDGALVYMWPENSPLYAFRVKPGASPLVSRVGDTAAAGIVAPQGARNQAMPGGLVTISAQGKTPGTGVLWAVAPVEAKVLGDSRARLYALDAENLNRLWQADLTSPGGDRYLAKFISPTVAAGRVYVVLWADYRTSFIRSYGL